MIETINAFSSTIFSFLFKIVGFLTGFIRDTLTQFPIDINITLIILSLVLGRVIMGRAMTMKTIWLLASLMVFLLLRFV